MIEGDAIIENKEGCQDCAKKHRVLAAIACALGAAVGAVVAWYVATDG